MAMTVEEGISTWTCREEAVGDAAVEVVEDIIADYRLEQSAVHQYSFVHGIAMKTYRCDSW